METLEYYSKHGRITNPGKHKNSMPVLLNNAQLCDIVNNLILIDFLDNMKIIKAPEAYKSDINIRNVEEKLDEIFVRNESHLTKHRSSEEKILGNCRDTSLLLCAMFRQNGIAARVRSGFATIFSRKKKYDHWLCEYWEEKKARWIKVDSWMYQIQHYKDILPPMFKKGMEKLSYNPLDVEDKFFISGGLAWLLCQNQGDDPDTYGTYGNMRGLWFIRDNMIRDLFCLNKVEQLPWDCWGIMGKHNSKIEKTEYILLDECASSLSSDNVSFKKINDLFLRLSDDNILDKLK